MGYALRRALGSAIGFCETEVESLLSEQVAGMLLEDLLIEAGGTRVIALLFKLAGDRQHPLNRRGLSGRGLFGVPVCVTPVAGKKRNLSQNQTAEEQCTKG